MSGEKNLARLIQSMKPSLNEGDFVFCTLPSLPAAVTEGILCIFREKEGFSIVCSKDLADQQQWNYHYVAAWITLSVHSSLEAVGLTAAVAKALAEEGISCNVIAAYFHDHIFVAKQDAARTLSVLNRLSGQ